MTLQPPSHSFIPEDGIGCAPLLPLVFFALTALSPAQSSGLNFAPVVAYSSGGYAAYYAAVADVNDDGKPDLLVMNQCADSTCATDGTAGVLLGNGDGTFQTAVTYDSGGAWPRSLAIADVNGDGKPDLVVANECASTTDCANGTVSVLLGNGDGTFQAAMTYDYGGNSAESVAVADVNEDGKPDIVVACYGTDTVAVLLGNGDGTFQTAVIYGPGGDYPFSVAIADVNGDGKTDLLVADTCATPNPCADGGVVGVLLGNGDGTFRPAVSYGSGGIAALSVAVADVNGDGKPDLVVANESAENDPANGSVGVLLGNGDGTFQPAFAYGSGAGSAFSVAVADVNGDGKPDVVVANCNTPDGCSGGGADGVVSVLLGNGDGIFQTAVTYESGGATALSVAVADVNGDGKPDLLAANLCASTTDCANGTVGVLINTPSPMVQLSPTSLTFATQSLGTTSSLQNVTMTNTGAATLNITSIAVNGDFGQTNTCGSTLGAAGSCTISITFTPTAVGTRTGTVSISDNAPDSPQSIALSGTGAPPTVTLSPSSLNFGTQLLGVTSAPQTITLSTNGPITITSIATSALFAQTNNCGNSLGVGQSCTISVTFIPTALGVQNGTLTVADNGGSSPQTASLTGTGVQPAVTVSPASLVFPTQVVFTTSSAQAATLTNTGTGTLTITSIAVTGQFSQTNTCGTTVAAGASCTISVSFKPKNKGPLTGTVTVTDNAPGSPQRVTLSGTGTYIQLTPTSLNFGNQPVGTKSLPQKVTLSNKGSVSVSLTSIAITGLDAHDFAETNTCKSNIAAGASCFITVTFKPKGQGLRSASLSVSDNAGGSPQAVGLTGTGT